MKKPLKNVVILLFTLALMLPLGGCFQPPELPPPEPVPTVPPEEETEYPQITMMLKTKAYVMESWPVMQALFKLSGTEAYIRTVRPQHYADVLARSLSSGDIKDMVQLDAAHGLAVKELFINTAPLFIDQAPHYFEWSQQHKELWNALSTNTGEIFVFPLRQNTQRIRALAFMADDIDADGPLSQDLLYDILNGRMLAIDGDTLRICEMMAPYFGTSTGSFLQEASAVYGPTSESFKEMLLYLGKLYRAGMLSKDIGVSTREAYVQSVESGEAAIAICPEEDYEWAHRQGLSPVMLELSEDAFVPSIADEPESYGAISRHSGNEQHVIRFIETCFSPAGRQLLNSGIPGVHSKRFDDGSVEMTAPYAHAGTFQWHEQGLTPEGVPGIYYSQWSRFERPLYEQLLPMRDYIPSEDTLLKERPLFGEAAKGALITEGQLNALYHKWWTAFIKGEKSINAYWPTYLSELRAAGLHRYVASKYGSHVSAMP